MNITFIFYNKEEDYYELNIKQYNDRETEYNLYHKGKCTIRFSSKDMYNIFNKVVKDKEWIESL